MTNEPIPVDEMIPLMPTMAMPPRSAPPKPEPVATRPEPAPRVEPPKVEASKSDAPKVETPKSEAPKAAVPKADTPKTEPTRRPAQPKRTFTSRLASATGLQATRKQAMVLGAAALSLGAGLYAMKLLSPTPSADGPTVTAQAPSEVSPPPLLPVITPQATLPIPNAAPPELDVVKAPAIEPIALQPVKRDEPLTLPKMEEPSAPLTLPAAMSEPRSLPKMEIVREPEPMKLPEPGGLSEPSLPGLIVPTAGAEPKPPVVPPKSDSTPAPLPVPPIAAPTLEIPASSSPAITPPTLTPPALEVPKLAPPAIEPVPMIPSPVASVPPIPATLPMPDASPMAPAPTPSPLAPSTLPLPAPSPVVPSPSRLPDPPELVPMIPATLPMPEVAPRVAPLTEPVVGSPIEQNPIRIAPTPTPMEIVPTTPAPTPPPAPMEIMPTPAIRETPRASVAPVVTPVGNDTPRVPERPVRTDYDVGLHVPRAGETYESISEEWYNSRKFAAALRAYNQGRNKSLQGQGPLEVPPIEVLRKAYPTLLNGDVRTAGPTSTTTEWTAPGVRSDPAYRSVAGREFVIPVGGMTMREAARAALGSDLRWAELFEANPEITNPSAILPAGTRLRLP